MKSRISVLVSVLMLCIPASAQNESRDSLDVSVRTPYEFRPAQAVLPSVLVGSAVAVHYGCRDAGLNVVEGSLDDRIQHYFYQDLRKGGTVPELSFDNYLQYAPFVMDLGLGMLGAKARNPLLDRTLEMALGTVACAVMSWSCKQLFYSIRPNGNKGSFPSGHTDTVFLGAELVRMEYGWGWGSCSYAMGVTVGVMRMYNNWHWFSDVLFGAGIGILAANIGGWLLEPVKDLLGIPTVEWDALWTRGRADFALYPSVDPMSGAYCASFSVVF